MTKGSDIRKCCDKASARHGVATNFHRRTITKRPLGNVGRTRSHMAKTALDVDFDIGSLLPKSLQVESKQVIYRHTNLQQMRRIEEKVLISLIPSHEAQIAIDHGNALPHILQRGFQHTLIESKRLRSFAHNRCHCLQIMAMGSTRCIQQKTCRGSAQYRCQLALDRAFQLRRRQAVAWCIGNHQANPLRWQKAQCDIPQGAIVQSRRS
ncbi:MAG: hypothetical protein BWZ07_02067 [Alphaproteobacteria bacterium ADurb.BinA280]|nr:MAG: hypothetical protein BWZ07_02067 [Alphaproteobacteria bacterium ADurb.BinA280]